MNQRNVLEHISGSLGSRQDAHERKRFGLPSELIPEQVPQPHHYWAASNLWYLHKKLSASPDSTKNAVAIDVRVMHGNPTFRGTRIPIYQIVEELADGTTLADIVEGYPSLTLTQIRHGLDFAASLLRIYDEQIPD